MSILCLVILLDRAYDEGTEVPKSHVGVSYIKRAIRRTLEREEVPDIGRV